MLFIALSGATVVAVVGCCVRFAKREQIVATVTWDGLLSQLHRMDVRGLREIADCYLQPTEHQLRIEPGAMWQTVGGFSGIQKLRENTTVILNLAMYAERWNDANGRLLSEIMRRDAARIQTAVRHIEIAMLSRRGLVYLGLELQEAISSYCLMRARLLGMYRECHAGLLPKLEEAL